MHPSATLFSSHFDSETSRGKWLTIRIQLFHENYRDFLDYLWQTILSCPDLCPGSLIFALYFLHCNFQYSGQAFAYRYREQVRSLLPATSYLLYGAPSSAYFFVQHLALISFLISALLFGNPFSQIQWVLIWWLDYSIPTWLLFVDHFGNLTHVPFPG